MIQEVGLENLPNSYISLIEVSDWSLMSNVVNVHFRLKDVKKNKEFSWYNRGELGKYLKVLVVVSSNQQVNEALDVGKIPLDKSKISKISPIDSKEVQFSEIRVGFGTGMIIDEPMRMPYGDVYHFDFNTKFYVHKKKKNVKVYCAAFIDTKQYSEDYKLDLVASKISSYTGPVASEELFKNGEVPMTSFEFRTPQGDLWTGPVRLIGGSFYSGSKGKASESDILKRITVSNMKVKDYRKTQLLMPKTTKGDFKLPTFSPLYLSYDEDASLSSMFSIDLFSLLLRNSNLARRLASVNEELLQKMVQNIKLEDLSISKVKVKTRIITTKSGSKRKITDKLIKMKPLIKTKDRIPYSVEPVDNKIARLTEIIVDENPNIRHFAIKDYDNHKAKGEYYYDIKLEAQDPVKKYVDSLAEETKLNMSFIKAYSVRSKLKKNQNLSRTRFLSSFVSQEQSRFGQEQQPWNIAAKLYATYYALFLGLDSDQTNRLINKAVSLIHPRFATPTSVDRFVAEYSELYQNFITYFNAKVDKVSNISSGNSKGRSSAGNKIFTKYRFEEPIIHEDRDKAASYCDFKKGVYPTILSSQFVTRMQDEKKKFFNSTPSLIGTNLEKISKEAAKKIANQADNGMSFLTPQKLVLKNKSLDTRNPSGVDLEVFNKMIGQVEKQMLKEAVVPRPKKKKKINIKTAKKIDAYLKKDKEVNKTVEENLGKASKFRAAESLFKPTFKAKVAGKIKSKIKSYKKQKVSAKQFSADSDKVKKLIKNIDKVMLPPSFVSVLASESTSTKNNVLTAKIDMTTSPETRDFFSFMYTSPMLIEVIGSYKKDARGRAIYSQPMWRPIDSTDLDGPKPLICRMKPYKTKAFDTNDLDINISNENFVITFGSEIKKKFNKEEVISIKNVLEIANSNSDGGLEYQKSNPINQSSEKDGPLQ
tara:strand:- start:2440 stop:5229 length:2790 start_codon:yes stop_codon:yes gene_type:complete